MLALNPIRMHEVTTRRGLRSRGAHARRPCVQKERSVSRSSKHRRGAATVEFAIVALPLFLFVFISFELGRALMARHSMEEASRAGCRVAILQGADAEAVEAEVDQVMALVGITDYTVAIEPVEFQSLSRWSPITITVAAPFSELSWLPTSVFLESAVLSATSTLPKECPADP